MPLQLYEKQKILDACFSVFVRNGYSKTSTAILAEAAGISKALIFHHFKSKKKLYISVLGQCFETMSHEIIEESPSDYGDFFEAKEKMGKARVEYMRKNPHMSKILFEAFYNTPEDIKIEIQKFKAHIHAKYDHMNAAKDEKMKQLFNEISLRKGIDPDEALELINIVSEHFRLKLATELTDEKKLSEDEYWENFFDKKGKFMNMIRYGIEQR